MAVKPVLRLKIRFYIWKYSFKVENTVLDRKTGFTKLKIQFIFVKPVLRP